MKVLPATALALALTATACSSTQDAGIEVSEGQKLTYSQKSESSMDTPSGGQGKAMEITTEGTLGLLVKKVLKDSIVWSLDVSDIKLSSQGQTMPRAGMPSASLGPWDFTTDRRGKVAVKMEFDQPLSMATGWAGRSPVERFFLPTLVASMKPGESRELKDSATNSSPMIKGMEAVTRITMIIHHDGLVDTLGTHAIRVRSEVTSMKFGMEGEMMEKLGPDTGGDGTASTTYYYSVSDSMLLLSSSRTSTRLFMPGDSAAMMTQSTTSVVKRNQ